MKRMVMDGGSGSGKRKGRSRTHKTYIHARIDTHTNTCGYTYVRTTHTHTLVNRFVFFYIIYYKVLCVYIYDYVQIFVLERLICNKVCRR